MANNAYTQRLRIIEWLKANPSLTTLQAREILDVMHPGARVMELRQRGHDIMTYWTNEPNAQGHMHRVAKYVLMRLKVKS